MKFAVFRFIVFRSRDGGKEGGALGVDPFFEKLDRKTAENSKMRREPGHFGSWAVQPDPCSEGSNHEFHESSRIHPDEKSPAGSFSRAAIRVYSGPWAIQKHRPLALNETQRTQRTQKGGAGRWNVAGGACSLTHGWGGTANERQWTRIHPD